MYESVGLVGVEWLFINDVSGQFRRFGRPANNLVYTVMEIEM
jgi:hypothetical protein